MKVKHSEQEAWMPEIKPAQSQPSFPQRSSLPSPIAQTPLLSLCTLKILQPRSCSTGTMLWTLRATPVLLVLLLQLTAANGRLHQIHDHGEGVGVCTEGEVVD